MNSGISFGALSSGSISASIGISSRAQTLNSNLSTIELNSTIVLASSQSVGGQCGTSNTNLTINLINCGYILASNSSITNIQTSNQVISIAIGFFNLVKNIFFNFINSICRVR